MAGEGPVSTILEFVNTALRLRLNTYLDVGKHYNAELVIDNYTNRLARLIYYFNLCLLCHAYFTSVLRIHLNESLNYEFKRLHSISL